LPSSQRTAFQPARDVLRVLDRRRIILTDEAVFLNADAGLVTLRGAEITALARSLLRIVDDESSAGVAIARFTAEHHPHADTFIQVLVRSGIVTEEREAAAPPSAFARFIRLRSDEDAFRRLESAALVIVGETAAAAHVVEQAVVAGCHRAVLVQGADALDSVARPDLIVAVTERDDLHTQFAVARWAHRELVPSLYVSANCLDARVGPLVRPGRTACWNCCRLRLLANDGVHQNTASVYEMQSRILAQPRYANAAATETMFEGIAVHVGAFQALLFLADERKTALEGAIWIFDHTTLDGAAHRVIPLPSCALCGGADSVDDALPFRLEIEWVSNGAAVRPGWVDAYTGIVAATWSDEADARAGDPVVIRALVADYADDIEPPTGVHVCSGKGLTRPEAFRGAIAECIERYSASRVPVRSLRYATIDELPGDVLSPHRVGLYADEQYDVAGFPFERFDPGERHAWVEGHWLDDGTPVWLPALSVVFATVVGEARYCQVTSNGLAAGPEFEGSALRAALELIERDALTVTWLCRLPAHRLEIDVLDGESRNVLTFLERRHAEVELFLLDVGVAVPTVLALGRGDGVRWPGLCAGAAANRTACSAARAAILELAATGTALSQTLATAGAIPYPELIRSDVFGDHARYYIDPVRARAADFLRDGPSESAFRPFDFSAEAFSSLNDLARVLARSDVRLALADVTSADVRLGGLSVVRAVADGLQPLHCGYGTERRASRRLHQLLRGGANPDPHPFC
jgi:ribosomal protein S12 methylthiotransferase accessory factor